MKGNQRNSPRIGKIVSGYWKGGEDLRTGIVIADLKDKLVIRDTGEEITINVNQVKSIEEPSEEIRAAYELPRE
jgi:hypothetical protein